MVVWDKGEKGHSIPRSRFEVNSFWEVAPDDAYKLVSSVGEVASKIVNHPKYSN
jgi:hypothetical protein